MAKIADSTTVSIDTLQLWNRNPRSIKEDRFTELKERLKRQGQIKPLLVAKDGTTVIGGNMRLRAMKELGIEEVWISQTEASTDKEIFDLALTDNEEFGYYEQEQVAELALELGLSPLELKSYALSLGAPTTLDLVVDKFGPEVEEDEVPEVDEVGDPESRLGEIYQLGQHRLMCGDSTDADAVAELMGDNKADIAFTSPPYNAKREAMLSERKNGKRGEVNKYNQYDDGNIDYLDLLTNSNSLALAYAEYSFVNLQLLAGNKHEVIEWLYNLKDVFVDIAFWRKKQVAPAMAENVMNSQTECIFIFGGNGSRAITTASFSRGSLSNFVETDNASRENENSDSHNATFPVAFAAHFVKNFTKHGGTVLDQFGGTGTTLIACEQTNRTCYMMELDPKYCDVIRKRYAKHIGEEDWETATPVVNKELVHG